ncbi:hypothetical protein BURKHO8Y_270029 [Burkholderia sp. 8Y]|nr:hypothetical protein BURKHO8Y_270029 [Burkholderia sp. 8Y]
MLEHALRRCIAAVSFSQARTVHLRSNFKSAWPFRGWLSTPQTIIDAVIGDLPRYRRPVVPGMLCKPFVEMAHRDAYSDGRNLMRGGSVWLSIR